MCGEIFFGREKTGPKLCDRSEQRSRTAVAVISIWWTVLHAQYQCSHVLTLSDHTLPISHTWYDRPEADENFSMTTYVRRQRIRSTILPFRIPQLRHRRISNVVSRRGVLLLNMHIFPRYSLLRLASVQAHRFYTFRCVMGRCRWLTLQYWNISFPTLVTRSYRKIKEMQVKIENEHHIHNHSRTAWRLTRVSLRVLMRWEIWTLKVGFNVTKKRTIRT